MKSSNKLDKKWFEGKRVVVFGIGRLGGGVSSINFLTSVGAHVIATDIKSREYLKESIKEIKNKKNVTLVLGQHRREDFINTDMIIKTPGCPWNNEYIKLAIKNNIPVETDASLFMRLCRNKVIGITGTKGKTTTSHMVTHFLKKSGYHTIQVGVGITPVLDRLNLLKKNTVVVFELSSWRLSAFKYSKISPTIAVFTSFFPDHMNYYKNLDEYWIDKEQIFKYQKKGDLLVYNGDDEDLVNRLKETSKNKASVSFNSDSSDCCIYIDDNIAYLKQEDNLKIADTSKLTLIGEHNKRNLFMAFCAVYKLGASLSKLKKAVFDFKNIKYRLEFVKKNSGVEYYNDTAATNPQATMVALDSFMDKNIILLVGGSDKNLDSEELAKKIVNGNNIKKVLFLKGKFTEKLINNLEKLGYVDDFEIFNSMEDIVLKSSKIASDGDIVLLSPAAASFASFKNEFDRGDKFVEEVNKL